jgi:biofilm PGA synthesis N-glycosyltransferase PgaC
MEVLFLICTIAFVYTFFGYPFILFYLTRNKKENAISPEYSPEITIILCIYNSAHLLKARINNLLACSYPSDKIKIIIVSDGSTDFPNTVVDQLNGKEITFIHYPENQGKSFALELALKKAKTDLVAFADIRQSFEFDALQHLAKHFIVPDVGAVSGNLVIREDESNKASEPGLYWKYEKWIREKESDINSMLGVTGAIYMARRKLIPKIPADTLLDDMYIPLSMIKEGYKIKFESDAIAYDISSQSPEEEFHRKVRTLAGNFQLVAQMPWLLSITKNPLFFQFFSHKIMRLIVPYCLLFIFLTSYLLNGNIYNAIFILQVCFYTYSSLSFLLLKKDIKLPFASATISFCSLHLASLLAGWKYLFFSPEKLWQKH